MIQKYAENCHFFHNFNVNYIIFVHIQAKRHFKQRHGNVILCDPAHQYEAFFPSLLASTLANNTMSFPRKIVSLVIHTLYPRKKQLSFRVNWYFSDSLLNCNWKISNILKSLPLKTLLIKSGPLPRYYSIQKATVTELLFVN